MKKPVARIPGLRSHKTSALHNVSSASARRTHVSHSLSGCSLEAKIAKSGNCTYSLSRATGSGTFGVVYQATVAETGETVAIKKVFQDRRYKNRELEIMRPLQHPNVISLKHSFYSAGQKPSEVYLNLVMEFVPDTAYSIIKHYHRLHRPLWLGLWGIRHLRLPATIRRNC